VEINCIHGEKFSPERNALIGVLSEMIGMFGMLFLANTNAELLCIVYGIPFTIHRREEWCTRTVYTYLGGLSYLTKQREGILPPSEDYLYVAYHFHQIRILFTD
jgi:hypothetical protein